MKETNIKNETKTGPPSPSLHGGGGGLSRLLRRQLCDPRLLGSFSKTALESLCRERSGARKMAHNLDSKAISVTCTLRF